MQIVDHKFLKEKRIFHRKLANIDEISVHNIDPSA
jgi:hypothetical protein